MKNIIENHHVKQVFYIILVLIISNGLLISLATYLSVGRPTVNLDYFFSSILLLANKRKLAILSFFIFFILDIFSIFSQIFVIIRLNDIFYLLKFIFISSSLYQIFFIILLFSLFIKIYFWLKVSQKIYKIPLFLFFNFLILFYTYNIYFNNHHSDLNRAWLIVDNQPVASQTLDFIEKRNRGFFEGFSATGAAFDSTHKVIGASEYWYKKIDNNLLPSKMLLIVNESWGIPHNSAIQKALLLPLIAQTEHIKTISQGEIAFTGITIGGEMRELCQLQPLHFNLKDITLGFDQCLPKKLQNLGYTTQAMHGAVGIMYDRKYWYSRAGLEKQIFYEHKQDLKHRCYSFPGACDIDLINELPIFFYGGEKKFFYWLTLNSHSIYDTRDIRIDKFNCQSFNIDSKSESCRNFKLQAQFFYSLAKIIQKPQMKGVEILIVGDHQPIILNAEEKQNNFIEGKVPWLQVQLK